MRRPYERTVKANGSVLVRVVVGYDGKKPVRRSKTFPAGTSDDAIAAWAFTMKAAHPYQAKKVGRPAKPDRIIEEWLAERTPFLSARTIETYESFTRLYLIGRLRRFDRASIGALFSGLRRQDGKPLSPHTVQTIRSMLNSILAFALETERIDAIPKTPRMPALKRAKQIRALAATDYHRLRSHLRAAGELELELMLVSGLRVSELLALEPKHFADGVRVEQARLHRWGSREVGPPKSHHSFRTVAIETDILSLIRQRIDALPDGERFVFQLGQTGLSKRLRSACDELGLARVSLHGLRHSHCTYLMSRGNIPLPAIAGRMGHHSPGFTLRQYAHLVPGMDAGIGEAIRAHRVDGKSD